VEEARVALGAVASRPALRQEAGLSQQVVVDELGIPQQTYANYEVARARPPVSMLPDLGRLFGVSMDELLGLTNGRGERGPAPKFQKQLERVSQLPKAQQRFVEQMLDTVLAQASR
jgi:transcriptional regulator with XRE-family HTH domain